ncbi:MAG: hypothetical protein H0X36_01145 [Sphingomonadaceae bacterium]|nr:hypothetical protein [Sphingomonadaceae bacterium]
MSDKDRAYLLRRLEAERAAVDAARDPSVKAAHREFVERYERLLADATDEAPEAPL